MTRPVFYILGFLLFGIITGVYASTTLIVLGLCFGLFLCIFLYRTYRYLPVFIFLAFAVIGVWRVGVSFYSHTTEPVYSASFSGVVLDIGITSGGNQRLVVRGEHPITGGRVRVMAYLRPYHAWAVLGQEISLSGELMPLNTPRNPGDYNQFIHLRGQKIDATIWPDSVRLGEVRPSLIVFLRQFRDRLAFVYDTVLPSSEAAMIKSMILGDRQDMDWDLANMYRVMGIFHILSISGLHVAILMMAANRLLCLCLPERRAGAVVLVIMVLYCLLTGAAVSTVRAVLMGGLLVFGKILYRQYSLLVSVSWAMVVLLIFEPLFLFNVGFQLSFSAVFGIGILSAPIERLLTKLRIPPWGKFRNGLAVGISAVVSTYNVFAFHFYEIPVYSILGNLVIAPTTTIILVLGIVVGLVGLISIPLASVLAGTVYYILRFYEMASHFFAALPYAMLLTGGGSIFIAVMGVLVLAAFAFMFNGFGESFKRRGVLLGLAVLIFTVAVLARGNPRGLYITMLDTWGNYTVLRHGGDVLVVGRAHGGEDALFRYLDMHGVARANGLVLVEPPRLHDAARIARLAERFDVFYLSDAMEGATASLAETAFTEAFADINVVPEIVFLRQNDVRVAGDLFVHVETREMGRIGLRIGFRDVNFVLESIGEEQGAVLMRSRGQYVEILSVFTP